MLISQRSLLSMAYSVKSKKSGKMYYLHSKEVELAGNRKQRIYYFAGKAEKNALDALPAGYEVIENSKTGLPMLRKKK
jgi:hypothetical protein